MHNTLWVASARVGVFRHLSGENHMCVLSVKEGQKRPGHALSRDTRHIHSLINLETVKTASSQGGALALFGCEQTQSKTQLKDMKMEFSS
jgi:hypothetical protein